MDKEGMIIQSFCMYIPIATIINSSTSKEMAKRRNAAWMSVVKTVEKKSQSQDQEQNT